jgi:hypothetical protein
VIIYKNGSPYALDVSVTGGPSAVGSSISDLIYLNGSTDYVELYVYSSQSTALTAASGFMSGCLVRAG